MEFKDNKNKYFKTVDKTFKLHRQSVDSIEDAGSFHLNSNETTNNDPETSSEIALDDSKHPVGT